VLVWGASRYDAELLAATSARVLLLGSVSVYSQDAGETVSEDSAQDRDPGPAPRDESARELRRAEEVVLARGGAVLRLAGIYARGRGPQTLLAAAPRDAEGRPRLEPPAGKLLNLIHEEDAARAALFALERDFAGVLNVSDGAPLTRAAFYGLAARSLGLPGPVFREGDASSLGKRVSNAKLLGLGFELRHPDVTRGIEVA
jgi:nucleoside-diphosphate-sugar epimerase